MLVRRLRRTTNSSRSINGIEPTKPMSEGTPHQWLILSMYIIKITHHKTPNIKTI